MEKTWRWFGPNDAVKLGMLRQIGVEGIVTSLHDVPNGAVWTHEKIMQMKDMIESHGMRWSVVESLPVSESIKYSGEDRDRLIDNYISSLTALGQAGIGTVCYNFMPVIDWIRTDLEHPLEDGTSTLYFDYARFAYFDMHILGREAAAEDYPADILDKVRKMEDTMTESEKEKLIDTIIVRTQGFVSGNFNSSDNNPVQKFKDLLSLYDGVTKENLRDNLKYFLEAIMPTCDRYGIDMCIHPDDPPMGVLGLPRIVSDREDISWLLECVRNPHNGLTFCAGSLSAGRHNDITAMAREFAGRTRFVHLRSCEIMDNGDFMEAPHTGGRADLVELVRIFENEDRNIPMRVDHGKMMLDDGHKGYNPGYGFHGRMLALGQVEGMMCAVRSYGRFCNQGKIN